MLNGELKKKTAELEQTQVILYTVSVVSFPGKGGLLYTVSVVSFPGKGGDPGILYTVSVVSFPGKGGDPYTVHC